MSFTSRNPIYVRILLIPLQQLWNWMYTIVPLLLEICLPRAWKGASIIVLILLYFAFQ